MPSTTTTTASSKSEALARARAWRDQRCATPPTSAKKVKKTAESHDQEGFTNEAPIRVPTRSAPPTKESWSGTTVATSTPKQEAKDRALTRAREFAARLKEKKDQPKEDSMDIDIPAVINIEDENLSTACTTIPTVHETQISPAEMEEMKRIAADMKKLSQRLEAVTKKNS
mmetsp:Transcript_25303/g.38266  ORF Transcript_25303/g.38266 Transcript_25303/m.38266 type:complete len:171 (+) Transcript_25303:56-568(+)|eukprot:scaffold36175_cov133-Skeletonema_dohrnii-CCMP3373.AAC.2